MNMAKANERLGTLDELQVPLAWERIRGRTPDPSLDPSATLQLEEHGRAPRSRRISLIAAALVIGLTGTVTLALAFRDPGNIATGPTGDVVKVTLAGGANAGATLTTGDVSRSGVPMNVIIPPGENDNAYSSQEIGKALGLDSFSI